jgi:AcrR family transcriptional regulator
VPSLWADTLDEHRALVMGRLLDAFAEVQAERGLDGVTLAAVAERAGLARSAVYNYVQDKHDLLFAHAERVIGQFVSDLQVAATSGDAVPERLRRYVRGSLRSFADDGGGSDLLPLLTPEEQARLFRLLAPVHDVAVEIVRDGVAEGTFAGDPGALVRHLMATLEGYRRGLTTDDRDVDALADTVTRLLLEGLRGSPAVR